MNHKTYFKHLPELETQRLLLRKLRVSNSEDIFEFTSIPEITKYLTWNHHASVRDTERFIRSVIKKYQANEASQWAIVLKQTKKVIGIAGFISYFPVHSRAEIAYVLSPVYWNQGIMSEVLLKVLQFGFNSMTLNRIEAKCEPDNISSGKVMQKIGMRYEGTLREYLFIKGEYRDYKIYSILRSEYRE